MGRATNLPADVRRVYLKPFENRTQRAQVEQILTRAIADEFLTRQRFVVVNDAASADAELSGAVVGFGVTPVTFDPDGRATEYEISITARVLFRRAASEEVLWANERYEFRENYPVEVSEAELLRPREPGDRRGRRRTSPRPWSATCSRGSRLLAGS